MGEAQKSAFLTAEILGRKRISLGHNGTTCWCQVIANLWHPKNLAQILFQPSDFFGDQKPVRLEKSHLKSIPAIRFFLLPIRQDNSPGAALN